MSDLAAAFLASSVVLMEKAGKDVATCLGQLSDEQAWARRAPHENSVCNLLLHLEGNLRQWFLSGMDGQADERRRDDEFTLERSCSAQEAHRRFAATLAESADVIGGLAPERLLTRIDPQPGGGWGQPTIVEAIGRIVGHLQLHTGQIILLTKQLRGRDLDMSIPRKR